MRYVALLCTPPAVLIGLDRPAGLLALVLLAVFATAVTRVGLWLLGDLVAGGPDARALRVGVGTFAAGTVVATSALVLGPLTVVLVVPAILLAALLFRPGRPRPSPFLSTPFVERRADER